MDSDLQMSFNSYEVVIRSDGFAAFILLLDGALWFSWYIQKTESTRMNYAFGKNTKEIRKNY